MAAKPKPKAFAWVRPLNQSDVRALAALGRPVPDGEILGLRTDGMLEKQAVLEQFAEYVFDIPHFRGYPGILVRLDTVPGDLLGDLLTDAWLAVAPADLAAEYLAVHRKPGRPGEPGGAT